MNLNDIDSIMYSYNSDEIEKRLNDIFNGYLGCDTGDTPKELQQNHHLIRCIMNVFHKLDEVKNSNSIQ